MPYITEIKVADSPKKTPPLEKHEFASPDQTWLAVFHDPFDWQMGAWGWQISLLSYKSRTDINCPELTELCRGKGVFVPSNYLPWSADSKILALIPWANGLTFFNTSSNMCGFRSNLFPLCVQWSPRNNLLLASLKNKYILLDEAGKIVTSVKKVFRKIEPSYTGWLPSGEIFFVVGRKSQHEKPRISFFNANKGQLIFDQLLDPSELIRYDERKYKKIKRNRHSLVITSSSGQSFAVGYFLDTWNEMVYNQDKATIFLSLSRPTSDIYELDGYPACQVEPKWVSIKLYG